MQRMEEILMTLGPLLFSLIVGGSIWLIKREDGNDATNETTKDPNKLSISPSGLGTKVR